MRELDTIQCLDAITFMRQLDDDSIDMGIASPPYDNLRTYGGHSDFDFETIAQETYRVLKPGGVLVWVVGDATIDGSETLTSMRQALYFVDVVGFKMHDTMIYHKSGSHPNIENTRYNNRFEYMFVLSKGTLTKANLQMKKNLKAGMKTSRTGTRQRNGKIVKYCDPFMVIKDETILHNVWDINVGFNHTTKDKEAYLHPAMFPEKLAERHILTWSNSGDIVMDYFMGSGTTAKMARNNGRHYIGCDINREYVDLARARLAKPYTMPMFEEKIEQEKPVQIRMFDSG